MRKTAWFLAAMILSFAATASDFKWHQQLVKGSDAALSAAYGRLVAPMPLKGRKAAGLTLERPAFKLTMAEGTLARETDAITGESRGYVFSGKATVDFSVDNPMERGHFKLLTGQEEWKGLAVDTVYILPTGPGEPFEAPFEAGVEAPAHLGDLKDTLHVEGFSTLAQLIDRASRDPRDVMVLFMVDKDIWCYNFDSESYEEVALGKLGRPPEVERWAWDAAVSQHLNEGGKLGPATSDKEVLSKYRQDLTSVTIKMAVETSGELTGGSTALAFARLKKGRAVLFSLDPMLTVSKVHTPEGSPLPFLQCDFTEAHQTQEYGLLVLLPDEDGREGAVVAEYGGKVFAPTSEGSVLLKDEDEWFVNLEDADGATYDITASVPSKYEAISIGDLKEKTVQGDKTTYHYHFADKSPMATIIVGKFRHTKENVDGIDIDVACPDTVWTATKQNQEKSIKTIVFNCFKIYTKFYGPPRYKKLSVGECMSGHGRGFPTLLLLSALLDPGIAQYYGRADASLDQQLVSHETAHQWWGNIVEPLTYRDAWISEAMAELASYDYAMVVYGPAKLKDVLSATQFNLDGLMAYSRKPSWMQGPIELGERLSTSLEPRSAYQLIVYNKGAWALVNLRKIAVASPAGTMQAFFDGLQDFLKTYSGGKAGSRDFQAVMERHYKMDLGWFFDQYFRRTEIPNVTVKTRVEKDGAGWKLVAEGEQDTDFRLYIPIQFAIGEKLEERVFRLDGRKGSQEFPLPAKPSSVKVDPIHETLARVKG